MNFDENKVYTVEEVAVLFKVDVTNIRLFVKMGILPGTELPSSTEEKPQWIFIAKDLEELERNLEKKDHEKMAAWKASFVVKPTDKTKV